MSKDPLLTIGYSTLAERVSNIKPPLLDIDHNIFISIQNPAGIKIPVSVSFNHESATSSATGVAKSRNTVLSHASTKYLLFADDEIEFSISGIKEIVNYMEENPGCDLVLAQTTDTEGNLRKRYPTKETPLNRFNSAKAATYEMLVRTSSIKQLNIRFDENFGAGVPQYLGDEYIFITDLIKQGGRGTFLPVTLAVHPTESSGSGWGTQKDLSARAAVFTRVFGPLAPLVRFGFILKNFNKLSGLKDVFTFTFRK